MRKFRCANCKRVFTEDKVPVDIYGTYCPTCKCKSMVVIDDKKPLLDLSLCPRSKIAVVALVEMVIDANNMMTESDKNKFILRCLSRGSVVDVIEDELRPLFEVKLF